jgi:phosphoserine phosphatase
MPLAIHVKQTLGLDYAFANNLELSPDGLLLTGNVYGNIVNGERKADLLSVISQLEHVPKEQVRRMMTYFARSLRLEMVQMIC